MSKPRPKKINQTQEDYSVDLIALEEFSTALNRSFHALKKFLTERGIVQGDRLRGFRFLSSLYRRGESSVPDLMRRLSCSRQYIQKIAKQHIELGYVEARPHPRRKNASLLALTPEGESVFIAWRENYMEALAELSLVTDVPDLRLATRVLEDLRLTLGRK